MITHTAHYDTQNAQTLHVVTVVIKHGIPVDQYNAIIAEQNATLKGIFGRESTYGLDRKQISTKTEIRITLKGYTFDD